jgi:hypothetical protein
MRYIKLFENFYVGKTWISSKGGDDILSKNKAISYKNMEYNEEDDAFKQGYKAFEEEKSIEDNPYKEDLYPNSNLIDTWNLGFNTALKNKKVAY